MNVAFNGGNWLGEYWLAISTVSFGSLASALSLAKLVTWGIVRLRRYRHPHSLQLIACSGRSAAVEIRHHGEPAIWEARLRILRTADNYPNPDPMLRQCLLRKDGKSFLSLLLNEGESASIILASIGYPEFPGVGSGTWVAIQNAEHATGIRVDTEVVVQVNITANPPIKQQVMQQCFHIARRFGANIMECSDVACDEKLSLRRY